VLYIVLPLPNYDKRIEQREPSERTTQKNKYDRNPLTEEKDMKRKKRVSKCNHDEISLKETIRARIIIFKAVDFLGTDSESASCTY